MSREVEALSRIERSSDTSGVIRIDSIRDLSTLLVFRELFDEGKSLTIKSRHADVENLRVTEIDYSLGLIHVISLEFDVCDIDLTKESLLLGKLTLAITVLLGLMSGILISDIILMRFFNMGGIVSAILN